MMFEDRIPAADDAPEGEGAEVLDRLHKVLTTYVVFPSTHAAVAATLWIGASHAQDAWEHATRLVIKSPTKRCGKSRLLDLLEVFCHHVLITANVSPAALVRSITDHDPPTLLIDEADTVFAKRRGERSEAADIVRGLVNAGFGRGRPYTRWDVTTRALEECPTFAMAALAGIGDMPDTIEDRAVIITMRRRAPGEPVTSYRRRRDRPGMLDLRDKLEGWLLQHVKELTAATPVMPVDDREGDTWESLIAVADLAGGAWPATARDACRKMTAAAGADAEEAEGEHLLADLKTVFGDRDALYTRTILERLNEMEEAPWGDVDGKGKALDARGLAKLLRPYEVRPGDVREDGTGPNLKGYRREDLHGPWSRYVRDKGDIAGEDCRGPVADEGDTSATEATSDVADVAAVAQEVPSWCCERCGFSTTHRLVAAYSHSGCGGTFHPEEDR